MLTYKDSAAASEELLAKKLFVFDMDGTIYLGSRPFRSAVRFINELRGDGRKVIFFTNNASHSPEFYLEKLEKLGFSPSREELCTSGDVTCTFLNLHRQCRSVYLVGTPELYDHFRGYGIPLACDRDGNWNGTKPDIVITSFDTTLTYAKLERACTFIRNGAEYLSTHPDFNCPTEAGPVPDSGAIAAFVEASTGKKPLYFGKPSSMVVDMISEMSGTEKQDMVVFGDRMYTDIALGKRNGILSVLVLTGETTLPDVEAAAEADRPDILLESLGNARELMWGKHM